MSSVLFLHRIYAKTKTVVSCKETLTHTPAAVTLISDLSVIRIKEGTRALGTGATQTTEECFQLNLFRDVVYPSRHLSD